MNKIDYREIYRIVSRNFRYMGKKRPLFLLGGMLALGSLAVSFLIPYLYEQFMTLIQAGASYSEILGSLKVAFIALIIIMPLVCLGGYWQKSSANFATANMQRDVFGHVMRSPLASLETDRADKIMRTTSNVRSATSLFTGYTMTIFLKFIIYFFGALMILLFASWRYALLGMLLSAIMFWISTVLNVRLRALERKALDADSELSAVLMDMVSNLPIVKLLGIQKALLNKYSDAGEEAYRLRLKYKVMRGGTDGILDFMSFSAQALAISLGMWMLGMAEDFASLVYVASMFSLMLTGTRELGNAIMFIQTTIVNSQRVYDILDQPKEADKATDIHANAHDEIVVELSHVGFEYTPGKPVLHDICLAIKKEQMVGIVGGSGCGKSTLLKLLTGFYMPTCGDIHLGGVSVHDMSLSAIRAYSAYIPQDAQLFDGSVAENVVIFADTPDSMRVDNCLQAASLDISADAQVGENGSKLSGGQAQRVSIARALYKDAPVYLLDEATSALDSTTEGELQHTIDTVLKDKTVICVAHRLSTVQQADIIIYMEDGRIAETGTHTELLAKNGGYAKLYTKNSIA